MTLLYVGLIASYSPTESWQSFYVHCFALICIYPDGHLVYYLSPTTAEF